MANDDTFSFRSSLSLATTENDDDQEVETIALRTRILTVVKNSPNLTIRPARLSQELGLSITDASAELCGLLKVVGEGSTFNFEQIDGVHTMVFTFPPDFERKALAAQRQDDWWSWFQNAADVAVKVLKVLTAFGLIVSTVIVAIAGMVALVAALVALSRGGGDSRQARHHVSRQLSNLFITVRQLIWCYAMFGPVGNDQDPFFHEAAYDTWLVLSLCCGNPSSLWFWMRAGHLRRRRRRFARGWGRSNNENFQDTASDLEGVSLIRRGAWGQDEVIPASAATDSEEHRGLLSVAVEFLFGPKNSPGPSESDKWRLRSAIIVEKSTPMALQELTPFADAPPASLDDPKVVSEGLLIVAHFNGIPSSKIGEQDDLSKSLFIFPELVAESQVSTRYEDSNDYEDEGLFYIKESTGTSPRSGNNRESGTLPKYMQEHQMTFSKLTAKQFYHCLLVAVLNFIGVVWFAQSLDPGGILEANLGSFGQGLKWGLIPVLWFYARLFFVIPGLRLAYILGWNRLCKRRNQRRCLLAEALKETSVVL